MILEISTHSGTNEKIYVEEYDAQNVADVINGITKNETGNAHHVIVLGANIYSCIDIKIIKVVEAEELDRID